MIRLLIWLSETRLFVWLILRDDDKLVAWVRAGNRCYPLRRNEEDFRDRWFKTREKISALGHAIGEVAATRDRLANSIKTARAVRSPSDEIVKRIEALERRRSIVSAFVTDGLSFLDELKAIIEVNVQLDDGPEHVDAAICRHIKANDPLMLDFDREAQIN